MDKREYLKLTIEEQVNYINQEMKQGKSLTATCKELLVTKSSTLAKFKKHGYKLINGQYILKQIPEEQNLKGAKELQLADVAAELQDDEKLSEVTSSIKENENETIVNQSNKVEIKPNKVKNTASKEKKSQLKAKVGRPQKYKKDRDGKNIDKKKFTLEIDKKVYKALKHKKNNENIAINIFVEDLLRKAIEDKYFKNVD